jgi:tetratricopeptide (TPR) repeat protein
MTNLVATNYFRGENFSAVGDHKKAIEFFSLATEHPDGWRSLGLAYADNDDLENSIIAFRKAVEKGDLKALPWLVGLLKAHKPESAELPELSTRLEKLQQEKNIDVVFSTGNMHLMSEEPAETLRVWSEFLADGNWIFLRNAIRAIIFSYQEIGELVPAPYGPIKTQREAIIFARNAYVEAINQGESVAATDFLHLYMQFSNSPELANFSPRYFFSVIEKFAREGDIASIIYALGLALDYPDEKFDIEALMQLANHSELNDFPQVSLSLPGSESQRSAMAIGASANNTMPARNKAIDECFTRAESARKNGDSLAEINAWVDGTDLGSADAFYNLGLTLCNELGIQVSFMGAMGGEDKVWSSLAKGISISENRPGRGPSVVLNQTLSSSQIARVRKTFGGGSKTAGPYLAPGHKESFVKVCDLFEKCGFTYRVLDENLIAFPFTGQTGGYVLFCELTNDEGNELALLYSCLFTSKFNEKGEPLSSPENLTKTQEKAIEILVRDQELIFPSMMIEMGTVFRDLPEALAPASFLNIQNSHEYWSVIGADPESMLYEAIPTKHEFKKIDFGYGINLTLQSNHFESAIRAAFASIIGILETTSGMAEESAEIFDLIFGMNTQSKFDFSANMPPYSELAAKGSATAVLFTLTDETSDQKRLEKLEVLAKDDVPLAIRIMTDSVEITKDNIGRIEFWLEKEAARCENDSQLRDALNNVGWKYMEFGENEKAMSPLTLAARLGSGNALSNLNWTLLSTHEHKRARNIFDESYYKIMTTRQTPNDFEQGANCRSNDALHRMALGASHDELREIWGDEHYQGMHVESIFYPILLLQIEGKDQEVKSAIANLQEFQISDLRTTFQEIEKGTGWFAELAKSALKILPEEPHKKKGLFRK